MTTKNTIKKVLESFVVDSQSDSNEKRKILIVAAEAAPYATIGGFSNVVGYLSKALEDLGHDVRIFIPKFGSIDEKKYGLEMVHEGLRVPTDDESNPELICNVKMADPDNRVPAYFLENQEYYEKRANVYGYRDDATRWALLSRGVIEFIKTEKFIPDVIHCNDWHTGIIPNYLETIYKNDILLSQIATVFTIHNMSYQGMFDHNNVSELDFDDGRSSIAPFFDERLRKLNFLRRGIIYSDVVNAVSKTYSKEIMTSEFGEGLDQLLLELKGKVFGIVNGLDYDEYNPATDKLLAQNYDIRSLDLRVKNKLALQDEFDLEQDPDIPVAGFVGRLDSQKGVDMMVDTLHHVLKDFNMQFVQIGGGSSWLAEKLRDLKENFPKKVGIHTYPNFTLPRLVFSGSDIVLFPSRFEPCGIVQLEAMRYGAIPIVRKVGGLADTVTDFDVRSKEGTGFVFKEFDKFSLFGQIVRALQLYNDDDSWRKLQKNAMSADYSWKFSAEEYNRLYDIAINFSKKAPFEKNTSLRY